MDRAYVMELVQAFQTGKLSRREFTKRATTAIGSAAVVNLLLAACSPVVQAPTTAQQAPQATAAGTTEPTSASGLITGVVDYPDVDNGTLMGYAARPDDSDTHHAVVVIQEWWGVDDHIKDVTRRFAREGFVALAPDLYHGVVVSEPSDAQKMVMELDMDAAVREIQQAIRFLQQQDYVAGPKVGIVGFCMGGRLVLMTALAEEDLGAAVAFYGSPLTADQAAQVKAPLLGLYGSQDQSISVDKIKTMEDALNKAGIENEFHIYDGAGHAFFNDTRPSYNEAAAQDAWPRTLAWFRDHLGS